MEFETSSQEIGDENACPEFNRNSDRQYYESDRAPKATDYQHYRCDETFQSLLDWLRGKGVEGNKPLHALRKLYGSALCDLHGLHVASSGLRHSDVRTTSEHYVDRRVRVTSRVRESAVEKGNRVPVVHADFNGQLIRFRI